MGRGSSELREVEGTGDNFMMEGEGRDINIMNSSTDESYYDVDILDLDETTFIVTPKPDPSENVDITTLVIPSPEEIQGSLMDKGVNSRSRKVGIKVTKENGQFLCPVCGHPFKYRTTAVSHTYTHMNELELQKVNIYYQRCPNSPHRLYFNRRDYTNHINSHKGVKNFKCQICKKGFGQKGALLHHMLTHVNQGSEEVPIPFRHFQCYFCHKKFGNMSHLILHLYVHTKEKPIKCSYCNKLFRRETNVKYHIRQAHTHPENPKLYPCLRCPKTWNDKGQLTQHIKVVHGEKVHKCPKCSKLFSTKRVLDRHVDSIHRKIRHRCPECDKSYSTKSHVMCHIKKNHGGDRSNVDILPRNSIL